MKRALTVGLQIVTWPVVWAAAGVTYAAMFVAGALVLLTPVWLYLLLAGQMHL
jgi:hypothetical protein